MLTVVAILSRFCGGPRRAFGISLRGSASQGHQAHFTTVAQLLRGLGYSLQANVKIREGTQHPDRDAQFRHINAVARRRVDHGEPVISVDTKKKELVGDFKNAGREWRPTGEPELVRVHDFKDQQLGKAIPYGIYDIGTDQGWVNVGIDHDTAQFAVNSIRSWWEHLGQPRWECHRICVRHERTGVLCLQSKIRRRCCSSEMVLICMAAVSR